ncbi:MAG: DUF6930 domain-containing protein [Leptolyngbyaceae cyanobacterium]
MLPVIVIDPMSILNQSTIRRLQKLPQVPSVWEGDRRLLRREAFNNNDEWGRSDLALPQTGDCILWVDGSQGIVRAMDVVPVDAGQEAVVRTLLRAMEHPHSPGLPARPQKIVVNDRELLFFLRGVLQDLDISFDYAPELPLINEIFRSFEEAMGSQPPPLPPDYADALIKTAFDLWDAAPWNYLADHEIIELQINQWDVETLYASVMGMLGMEYGILFYRSLDSLKRFRQQVLSNESMEDMEQAFLGQDCLFVTYEAIDEDDEPDEVDLGTLPESALRPTFGNLHPLEGLRSFIYEEEAATFLVAMDALQRFIRQQHRKFAADQFPELTGRYRVPIPQAEKAKFDKATLTIQVSTLPALARELMEMAEGSEQPSYPFPTVRDDLIPENSYLSLGVVPWDLLHILKTSADYYQSEQEVTQAGDGLPIIMIQTSRPKAKTLIQAIKDAGSLTAICFNPGKDPFGGNRYDLGLLQTGNGELHLFGEFEQDDPAHLAARKKWDQRCHKTKGICGLIIAKGLTGANRGNPQVRDMMALFETKALSSEDLGLGTLQLGLQID